MKTVYRPVKGEQINGDDCLLICDVADKMVKPNVLPEGIEWNENQRSVCKSCKHHADLDE